MNHILNITQKGWWLVKCSITWALPSRAHHLYHHKCCFTSQRSCILLLTWLDHGRTPHFISINLWNYIYLFTCIYKKLFFFCSNSKDKKDLHSTWNKEHLKSASCCSSTLEMGMEPLIPNPQQLMMEKYHAEICSSRADGAGASLSHNDVMQQSSYGVIFPKSTSNCSLSSN